MSAESFMRPGAVDLSGLAARSQAPAGGSNGAVATGVVVEVTEATFQAEVLNRSMSVPVVIDFWADWCQPCKQLSPILEKLAAEYDGRFLLATIDVDANQQLGAAFQVQSIPSVFAVLKGQPVPLFQGAMPEPQVREVLEQLFQVAAANGVTGRLEVRPGAAPKAEPAEPPHDPRYDTAHDAIEKGDFDAAAAAYRSMLAESPTDPDAKAGLAQAELLGRNKGNDLSSVVATAALRPADVDAQLAAADAEVVAGRVDSAFSRLVDTVRRASGEDRERVRARLVELFEIVGLSDPRVLRARSALASALF
ncbi:MAG TPA: tetratricopeptide repeat protein [Jiangellaceae bacterium]|nr:tetratricopeptide repeat protein [Jiangellaceae bacterium]